MKDTQNTHLDHNSINQIGLNLEEAPQGYKKWQQLMKMSTQSSQRQVELQNQGTIINLECLAE